MYRSCVFLIVLVVLPLKVIADEEIWVFSVYEVHKDAQLDHETIDNYSGDQGGWGDRELTESLFEPIHGENVVYELRARRMLPNPHDSDFSENCIERRMLLETTEQGEIVSGLKSSNPIREMPLGGLHKVLPCSGPGCQVS